MVEAEPERIHHPITEVGSFDALDLNSLKSETSMSDSMDCPKCKATLYCDECSPIYRHFPKFKAPGCQKCMERYETEQKRLNDRLSFLKLKDPNPSNEVFKGDVCLVVHGVDVIHAHRFILAGKSPVFYKMFDVSILENQTGRIPIDDATFPVMRAVINYCYTAEILIFR